MIIDAILDRRASDIYTQEEFDYIVDEAEYFEFDRILNAFKENDNPEIQLALCEYIDRQHYNSYIKDYINDVDWTPDGFTN